jgi:NAD(P)-dependent dehydrogenase (short-subunit alcohol dehydrogenase family)
MKALSEQTILVTGSTDGLGRRLAAELARLGAAVIVHGRDPGKVRAAAAEAGAARGLVADLASLDEVRALAGQLERLDALVNNAGVIEPERRLSADGHELTFAVNHLAHFALTGLLLPKSDDGGRIVNVSSIGQAPLDFADVEFARGYDAYTAYARSKLAQVLFAFELADRLGRRGPTVNALHPATLMDTKMVRETFGQSRSSVEEGVEAALRLVTDPELDGVTGRFFDGTRESEAQPQAYDRDARRRLWELSEELTGVRIPV